MKPRIFTCRGCKTTVEVEIEGSNSYNVGEAIAKTGWTYGTCAYTSEGVWLCPGCAAKAKKAAEELFALTGTPYYCWTYILDRAVLEEWRKKQKV